MKIFAMLHVSVRPFLLITEGVSRLKPDKLLKEWREQWSPNLNIQICQYKGRHKKKLFFFFRKTPKGGGRGLAESEISLSEKTEIFLDFFFKRGGGPTYSKRVLS